MTVFLAALALRPDPVARAFTPAARAILAQPDRVTIYALEPDPSVKKPALGFRDALAARRLNRAEGKTAVDALFATVRDVKDGLTMSCFEPHHGLKVERGRRWVKVWICFTCRQTEIEESGGRPITVGSGRAGQATLDRLIPKPPGRRSAPKPAP